jgi:hypothetical protein
MEEEVHNKLKWTNLLKPNPSVCSPLSTAAERRAGLSIINGKKYLSSTPFLPALPLTLKCPCFWGGKWPLV